MIGRLKKFTAALLTGCILCATGCASLPSITFRKTPIAEDETESFALSPLPAHPNSELFDIPEYGMFEQYADPENLFSGDALPQLESVENSFAYAYDEDTGSYVKRTPFMQKDGELTLRFGLDGKAEVIGYSFTGNLDSVNAEQVIKEFRVLYHLLAEKYGKITLHTWLYSASGAHGTFAAMGEFDEEEIEDAIANHLTSDFYYAWVRPGNKGLYAYLSLRSPEYKIGLIYDCKQTFVPVPASFLNG